MRDKRGSEKCAKGYRWCVDVEVKTVLVHERRVPGGAHEPDRLGTDGCPVDRVVTLPASMWPRRLKNDNIQYSSKDEEVAKLCLIL
jgi:hypothetical protein